ncbi:uncharacterized protein LOC131020362 [Salvia miltiorrhiza]|uniref:uncharacterized protein LOC131020362 n=1 Tax=Salvia miltiorrhiza TaxID=226208 RepID=UPI0025AD2A58|nr:uncharacterized protein LOC131020362 [Salvia miltiorrhiza]
MPTLSPRQPSPPQQTPAHISALISPEPPTSQEKQSDNIEQPVLHSDQATSPHVSKKSSGKKKCREAQGPSSEPRAKKSWPSVSPVPQKGSQTKIQLPGSLLKLNPAGSWAFVRSLTSSHDLAKLTSAECWAVLDALTSSKDVAMLRELSTEQLVDMICFNLVEQIILVSEVGSRLESCEEKDAALKELKSEVKEKDVKLVKTRNLNAKLEAKNRELQQRLANAEKENEALTMKARAEGKEDGIKLCRERILMALDRPF